jgi:hypothetical protein
MMNISISIHTFSPPAADRLGITSILGDSAAAAAADDDDDDDGGADAALPCFREPCPLFFTKACLEGFVDNFSL